MSALKTKIPKKCPLDEVDEEYLKTQGIKDRKHQRAIQSKIENLLERKHKFDQQKPN